MKRLPHLFMTILLLASLNSFADSVHNFSSLNVNFNIFSNDGSGDNLGGRIFGSGVDIFAGGGAPYSWFNNNGGFAPGSTGGGGTTFFFDSVTGTIGSASLSDASIFDSSFNTGSFTFPLSPQNFQQFTVTLPGTIGVITIINCTDSGCDTYNLTTKSGRLTLSFVYYSSTNAWFGESGSFITTPEPATLGMVAFGLAAALCRKRRLAAI